MYIQWCIFNIRPVVFNPWIEVKIKVNSIYAHFDIYEWIDIIFCLLLNISFHIGSYLVCRLHVETHLWLVDFNPGPCKLYVVVHESTPQYAKTHTACIERDGKIMRFWNHLQEIPVRCLFKGQLFVYVQGCSAIYGNP